MLAEWLANKIVGPQLKSDDDIDFFVFSGKKKNGNVWIGKTPCLADFIAAGMRHHDIETKQVGSMLLPHLERLISVLSQNHVESFRFQASFEGFQRNGVIICDKNFHEIESVE